MSQSTVWKECRNQEKALRSMMMDRKKRAEKKRDREAEEYGDPLRHVFIATQSASIFPSDHYHQMQNSKKSL
jgi:hypothetical protein